MGDGCDALPVAGLGATVAAGIAPETHRWTETDFGHYARRKNGWKCYDYDNSRPMPKDALPGIRFGGPIRRIDR